MLRCSQCASRPALEVGEGQVVERQVKRPASLFHQSEIVGQHAPRPVQPQRGGGGLQVGVRRPLQLDKVAEGHLVEHDLHVAPVERRAVLFIGLRRAEAQART